MIQQNDTQERNSEAWSKGYLTVTEHSILRGMRRYFQQKAILDFLTSKSMRVLDVGCGNGTFIRYLGTKGFPFVYGVEPNEMLLREMQRSDTDMYARIKQGFSTKLPYQDQEFDCIYFFNVLHHLKNTDEYYLTMKEIDRCLRPGGIVVLLEPCNAWIYTLKRAVTRILSPWSPLMSSIYGMMMEEKEPVTYFFRHHLGIRQLLLDMKYTVQRDRKLMYQWILVMRKAEA